MNSHLIQAKKKKTKKKRLALGIDRSTYVVDMLAMDPAPLYGRCRDYYEMGSKMLPLVLGSMTRYLILSGPPILGDGSSLYCPFKFRRFADGVNVDGHLHIDDG